VDFWSDQIAMDYKKILMSPVYEEVTVARYKS